MRPRSEGIAGFEPALSYGAGDFDFGRSLREPECLADSKSIATPATCPIKSISAGYLKTEGFHCEEGCGITTNWSPVRSHHPQR